LTNDCSQVSSIHQVWRCTQYPERGSRVDAETDIANGLPSLKVVEA
jgi:hypothetical protein